MAVPSWFAQLLPGLSVAQLEQLHSHYELLCRWNKRMNLTSIAPGREAVIRHYCESLFFAAHLPGAMDGMSIGDVGSGAGFPGVPMAVVRSTWNIALIESNKRKVVFLKEATIRIPNVRVIAKRAEELKERFDWLVSRAVDPAQILGLLPTLTDRVGLMVGEKELLDLQGMSRIAWEEPIQLPSGERRFCLYGRSTWNA